MKGYKMMDIRNSLTPLVAAARKAHALNESMMELGYGNNPYQDIFGDTADAIWYLIGENEQTFTESVTYHALTDDDLTTEQRVDLLMKSYERYNAK